VTTHYAKFESHVTGAGEAKWNQSYYFNAYDPVSRTGCLVVDFDMPKMSGLDLHSNLSRLGKKIPTVLITAYPSDDIRARALRAGIICYIPKPFDESDLLSCIQSALDRAKGK